MHMKQNLTAGRARRVAFLGLMFALAMVLSVLEWMLPVLPGLPPGIKLGLSNIVTMYALFFLGISDSFLLAVLKSLFVFLTRGAVAGLLSGAGGLLSVCVMLVGIKLSRHTIPYTLISVCGGIFHNLGQLLMVALLMGSTIALYYLPVMLLSGFGMGLVTGILLRTLLPHLKRLEQSVCRGQGKPRSQERKL